MTDSLAAALDLAARGWPVVALHSPDPAHPSGCSCGKVGCASPAKHPRTRRGVKDASTDPDTIRRWWGMWPAANVGVATGGGLSVLDVDPRHDGDSALAELEAAHGEMTTLAVRTGGGGLHFYFAGDLPSRGGFRPGLDLQGAGRYVVAPPSRHVSGGRYEWVDPGEEPHAAPGWLVDLLAAPSSNGDRPPAPPGSGLPDDVGPLLDALDADCSHDEWLRVGMALHHADPDAGLEYWDGWSAAAPARYPGPEEIRRRWDSFDAERRTRAGGTVATIGTLRHMATERGYRPRPQSAAEPGEADEDAGPEPLFRVDEARFERFLASDPPARRWIFPDRLPWGVVGILASMGGAGKSQLVYQMGVSVCTGLPFLGWDVAAPGGFLYLAGEDDDAELHRRGHLLVGHYARLADLAGEPFERHAVGERLHVVSRVAADNLLTRAGGDGEVHPTPLVDRLIRSATEIPDLRVVVLDPASRFKGGKANHEEDATRFVEVAERIREATGATVLVTSHVSQTGIREGGGQEIVRGSTALVDGVRWVATLQRLRRDRAKDYDLHDEEADRYLRLEIPKSNYTAPFPGLWLRREAGGVLVPTDLAETPTTDRLVKAEREYVEIVARLQALLKDRGPQTRYAIRAHCGLAGALKAGDRTVRAVIERAIREEYLLDVDGVLRLPLEDD